MSRGVSMDVYYHLNIYMYTCPLNRGIYYFRGWYISFDGERIIKYSLRQKHFPNKNTPKSQVLFSIPTQTYFGRIHITTPNSPIKFLLNHTT